MTTQLRIVSVAVIGSDGKVYSLPPPNRHHNVIHMLHSLGLRPHKDEGFLDSHGTFRSRVQSMVIATEAGQVNRRKGDKYYQGPKLFSEDLW